MVELMVPRAKETAERINGFYEDIGWVHCNDPVSEFDKIIEPVVSNSFAAPMIAYYQTTNHDKIKHFTKHQEEVPSKYSKGLWLPVLQELVEICLIVPTDEDVHNIFDAGGKILEAHAHIKPREHAGRQEFRFSDPFNYALRVTADADS